MINGIIRKLCIYKNKEDYFQIGLIALWEAQVHFEQEKGAFLNYAYSMVKGRILNELRRNVLRENRITVTEIESGEWEQQMAAFDLPLEAEILECYCEGLNESQTKWVMLSFLEQKTVSEIAEHCTVSLPAVKYWRSSAIAKLKKQLTGTD
jgi:RNA polymerase sigma factor (sigma-70 family)